MIDCIEKCKNETKVILTFFFKKYSTFLKFAHLVKADAK